MKMNDDTNGHLYPTPATIKLFITKAVHKHTMDCIDRDAPLAEMFPADAIRTLDAAINKAVDEWEKYGVFAGLREMEDA
jgi:hypothetical protein